MISQGNRVITVWRILYLSRTFVGIMWGKSYSIRKQNGNLNQVKVYCSNKQAISNNGLPLIPSRSHGTWLPLKYFFTVFREIPCILAISLWVRPSCSCICLSFRKYSPQLPSSLLLYRYFDQYWLYRFLPWSGSLFFGRLPPFWLTIILAIIEQQTFFAKWCTKVLENDYLCYDFTSVPSYGELNE